MGGVIGTMGGGYDNRLSLLEAKAEAEKKRYILLSQERQSLDDKSKETASIHALIGSSNKQIVAFNREINKTSPHTPSLRKMTRKVKSYLTEIDTKLTILKQSDLQSNSVAELVKQQTSLEKNYQLMKKSLSNR